MSAKSRRRPVSTDKRFKKKNNGSDYGPPERWQHSGRVLELTERAGILAARAIEEHLIDTMVLRGVLDQTQSDAAFRLKLDFQRAGLAANTTARYSPERSKTDFYRGVRERSDAEEAAYQRWRNAVRELGLGLSCAVIATVCHDEPPAPADVPLLQKGLDQLVDWYGLATKRRAGKEKPSSTRGQSS
jgi:hypothetical protein